MSQFPTETPAPVLPYASPMAASDGGLWREGAVLIARKDVVLPPRCIKCNAEVTTQPIRKKMAWHHPAFALLILFNLIVYAIVAICVQKKGTIYMSVCDQHRAQHRNRILITWGMVLVSLGSFALAIVMQEVWPVIPGIILLIVAAIYGIVAVPYVKPSKIDEHFMWIKGISLEFLNEVPQVIPPRQG